ncbi:MAG: sigma-70 family RNA polymerase sigma factor [Myxococcales bacterium]|nr:sigma-70 family RNA polymerase sigma factor [Myxococcales bacterium]
MSRESERTRDLLRAAASGDDAALTELYERHVDGLYAFVFYRVGRDPSLAEDVLQETFLAGLERASQFDPARGSLHMWLCTLSRNIIRAQLRAARRPRELAATWARIDATLAQVFQALADEPLGDEVLAREETRELVHMTIANLPDMYRDALERKYVQGDSLREIAGALRVSEVAAKSLLARARRAFRETFTTLVDAFAELEPAGAATSARAVKGGA